MAVWIRFIEWLSLRKRTPDLVRLREIVSPSPRIRLLDVGGGAGGVTERVASGCGAIVVLEPDPRKVTLGRKLRPSIRFEPGRGETIPFADDSFDRVISVVAFHHVEDQPGVLREMHRVLRPSGKIAILELPPGRAPGHFGRWMAARHHGGDMTFLEPEQLTAQLESAGFHEARWESGIQGYLATATKPDRHLGSPKPE